MVREGTRGPRTRDDVVFRRLGDDFAVLDPTRQVVHVLNASAAAVWVMCDGEHPPADIADEVASAFPEAGSRDVVADVEAALADFAERGLLA